MCYCRKAGPVRHRRQVCGLADPKRYVVTGGIFWRFRSAWGPLFFCETQKASEFGDCPRNESAKKFSGGDYARFGHFRPRWPGWGCHRTRSSHSAPPPYDWRRGLQPACLNSQTFGILLHILQICRHLSKCDSSGDHDALTSAKVPPCTAGTETYRRGGAGVANVRDGHKRADVGRGFSHRSFLLSFLLLSQGRVGVGGV